MEDNVEGPTELPSLFRPVLLDEIFHANSLHVLHFRKYFTFYVSNNSISNDFEILRKVLLIIWFKYSSV